MAAATDASLARGDYQTALVQAQKALALHQRLGAAGDAAWDLNAVGLANQYLGRYPAALDAYRRALALDRTAASRDGEVTRLNNIGNVHLLQGRYSDALLDVPGRARAARRRRPRRAPPAGCAR